MQLALAPEKAVQVATVIAAAAAVATANAAAQAQGAAKRRERGGQPGKEAALGSGGAKGA